jgi:hypothetical protein
METEVATRDCIYAGPHTVMSPEHYLPEGLGRFQGLKEEGLEGFEQLENRVCRACNNEIGRKTEEQFLRAGPIAFFRWVLGVRGKDGPPPSPFYRGASGAPPILAYGRAPEFPFDLLWEVRAGTTDCFPLRQVVVEHPLAGIHPIPILDSMKIDTARILDEVREMGLVNARPIHTFASPEEMPWVSKVVAALGATVGSDGVTTKFEPRQIDIIVKVQVTSAFFRAVAKIGFHYALKVFPDLRGTEREFDSIKNFIWSGGDFNHFVRQRQKPVFANFRVGERPVSWAHILLAERRYEAVTAYAQFFVGPQSMPVTYEIRLGRNPSRIVAPPEQAAHIFLYPDSTAPVGALGIVSNLAPSRATVAAF